MKRKITHYFSQCTTSKQTCIKDRRDSVEDVQDEITKQDKSDSSRISSGNGSQGTTHYHCHTEKTDSDRQTSSRDKGDSIEGMQDEITECI